LLLSLRAPAATQPHTAATARALRTARSVGMKASTPGGFTGLSNQASIDLFGSPMGELVPASGVILPLATRPA
jgi:hypothetical protein